MAADLRSWLDESSDRSFSSWAQAVSAAPVEFLRKLGNINTPDDLGAFEWRRAMRR
jgi:molybdopterin-guanine dinucleotide biosynthesis protein A